MQKWQHKNLVKLEVYETAAGPHPWLVRVCMWTLDWLPGVQEVAQSIICYWKKDELRKELKGLKKKVDDMDKARKAAVMNEVRSFKSIFKWLFFQV